MIPVEDEFPDDAATAHDEYRTNAQELHVRVAAQRILGNHVRLDGTDNLQHFPETSWPNISLDLRYATLIDFDFANCRLDQAAFSGATFEGRTGRLRPCRLDLYCL